MSSNVKRKHYQEKADKNKMLKYICLRQNLQLPLYFWSKCTVGQNTCMCFRTTHKRQSMACVALLLSTLNKEHTVAERKATVIGT